MVAVYVSNSVMDYIEVIWLQFMLAIVL